MGVRKYADYMIYIIVTKDYGLYIRTYGAIVWNHDLSNKGKAELL